MPEPGRDHLDEALDAALTTYGETAPREGLERRVLAHVSGAKIREWPARWLAITIAAAATLCCGLLWFQVPNMTVHPLPGSAMPPRVEQEGVLAALPMPARDLVIIPPPARKPRRAKSAAEPKLARFPTPSPIGSEEAALLQLAKGEVRKIPRELMQVGGPIEPLEISAIEIKPLE